MTNPLLSRRTAWLLLLAAASVRAPLRGADAAPAPAAAESLDVTITGEAKDEVPITKPPAAATVSFDQVATLSREGQTDRVLTGPLEHLHGLSQVDLLTVDSRQAYLGMPAKIPSPPFLRMEVSPGLVSSSWQLLVLDQNDKFLQVRQGAALPKHLLEWDGFLDGAFRLHPGPAYTPVLVLSDKDKRDQRYFGEPVNFAALQYVSGGKLHIEFDNNRLFERGRAEFSSEMRAYLGASLNILRQHIGQTVELVLYANPGGSIPYRQRLENLKSFYMDALALESQQIAFSVQTPKDRGDITEITVKTDE